MYKINTDTAFTIEILSKYINYFRIDKARQEKLYNYYIGKQEIFRKKPLDEDKPCNMICDNFCKTIVDNYLGYLIGKPVSYNSDNDITDIIKVFNYNDYRNQDMQLTKNALIYGEGYELYYYDNDKKVRFKTIDNREMFVIYDDTLDNNILYAIRMCTTDIDEQNYVIEVYDKTNIYTYKSGSGLTQLTPINSVRHYFNDVPVSIVTLNDNQGIFEQIITLQDAYNKLISGEIDDFEAFTDCYMLLTGANLDDDQLKKIKECHIIQLAEGGTAQYLTKSIQDTQIENILNRLKKEVFAKTNCPDFTDEAFMAQSGIAMQYKLTGFENVTSNIENSVRLALQRRIELISNILYVTNESIWRDITIAFTRNLPADLNNIATSLNVFRGLVSDETLLTQIPFITNVQAEMKRIKEQNESNLDMYKFNTNDETGD